MSREMCVLTTTARTPVRMFDFRARLVPVPYSQCVALYDFCTGPATDVVNNALELFYDLEQTEGPYAVNASISTTKVVQTRVQEINVNETAGLVGISCSVVFGGQQNGESVSLSRS